MYLNPYDLWLYEHAQGGTDATPNALSRSQHVLLGGDTALLPNTMGRADIVPAFTPSWNTNVWILHIDANNIEVKFSVLPGRGDTIDYTVSDGTRENVPSGSNTYDITHNLGDASAVVLVTPTWNTNIYSVTKAANTLTVGFGVPPASNSFIHWGLFRDSDDLTATDTVSAGTTNYTVQHDGGRAFLPGFFLPNWNTQIRFVDKLDANQTIISFNTPPYATASLDRRIKYV